MANYDAKDTIVRDRILETLELCVPFSIVANATPASKSMTEDEPSLLFLNTQGIQDITLADGAVDSQAELDALTFAVPNDAAGIFNLLLRMNEPVVKIVSAQIIQLNGSEMINCTFVTGSTNGITSAGNKVVFNADSAVNFATTNYNATLIVNYVVGE